MLAAVAVAQILGQSVLVEQAAAGPEHTITMQRLQELRTQEAAAVDMADQAWLLLVGLESLLLDISSGDSEWHIMQSWINTAEL